MSVKYTNGRKKNSNIKFNVANIPLSDADSCVKT